MPVLDAGSVADLARFTLAEMGKNKWTDIASLYQDYCVFSRLIREEKVVHSSGDSIQFNLLVDENGSAQMTGLYDTDNANNVDVGAVCTVPWRMAKGHWAIDRRVISMNSEPARIVNLLKQQKAASDLSMANLIESRAWQTGTGTADNENFWGIPHYIVWNTSTGFNGGNPSGYSDVAGQSNSTYPNWSNYTADFSTVDMGSATGLIRLAREAATKTQWKPPVSMPQYANNEMPRRGWYSGYENIGLMEDLLRTNNQNIGLDLAKYDGELMLRRVPVTYVPYMDSAMPLADPLYGIDWNTFHFEALQGYFFDEQPGKPVDGAHNVIAGYWDLVGNFVCRDRRKNIVIAKTDPMLG